jgi:hypothetical protein
MALIDGRSLMQDHIRVDLRQGAAVLSALLCLAVSEGHAQAATGKLEGQLRDSSGTPLSEAQVYIVGTAFSALSDPQGHYFINNIPAGSVNVRAALIGFHPIEVLKVRILAGQTITQDFTLEPAPVHLHELTVVTAYNELVPRDEVTTKQRVNGEFAERLPVDRLRQLLALQPGVVAGVDTGTNVQSLSIRGGRTDEVATYVDGVPVSPGYRTSGFTDQPLSQSTQISVGTNGLEEASVTTGATSAEFGNALSGVVSIQTPNGGNFAGTFSYETDEPFGVNNSLGFNRIEGSLSGSIVRNLGFFVSGVLEGQQSQRAGFDGEKAPIFVSAGVDTTVTVPSAANDPLADTTYVPVYNLSMYRGNCDAFASSTNDGIRTNYGYPCQGIRTPLSATSTYDLQGKLNYTFGNSSRLTLSYLGNQNQGRIFEYAQLYNPTALSGFRRWSNILTLNWTQNLQRSAERALALETYLSYQQDQAIEGPLSPASEASTRSPFGGFLIAPLGFLFDFENFPITDELVKNLQLDIPGSRRTPYNQEKVDQYNLVDRFSNNAYGLPGWSESGGPVGFLRMYRENRLLAKSTLDWQVDRYNRLRTGGEFIHHSIDRYDADLQVSDFADAYREGPIRWDLFLEDRLDLGELVLVGGLRLDAYDSRATRGLSLDTIPESPTFGEYISIPNPAQYGTGGATFDGRPLVIWQKDQAHHYVSPHLQVSFPVTQRTNVRFSYAHQIQAPDFALVLADVNFGRLGTDLGFGKTILFEVGVRHAFSDDMVLDIAAYNKDNLAVATARTFSMSVPETGGRGIQQKMTNADFGNTRGIDVRLDRRIGNLLNGTLAYTYQNAKSTGSDPFSNRDAGLVALQQLGGAILPAPQATLPTDFSRPHSLTGALSLTFAGDWKRGTAAGVILRNLGLYATFRYASGTPYTTCSALQGNENAFSGGGCLQGAGAINGARLPSWKQFDLRLTKSFDLGPLTTTAYLDARNLFNFMNTLVVFNVTGETTNPADRQNNWSTDSSDYAAQATISGVYGEDGSLDLRFGGYAASGCGAWLSGGGQPAAPNCVYLIRAEERYGDGDHVFTLAEQRRASDDFYAAVGRRSSFFGRGRQNFTGDPRRLRLGLEVSF